MSLRHVAAVMGGYTSGVPSDAVSWIDHAEKTYNAIKTGFADAAASVRFWWQFLRWTAIMPCWNAIGSLPSL